MGVTCADVVILKMSMGPSTDNSGNMGLLTEHSEQHGLINRTLKSNLDQQHGPTNRTLRATWTSNMGPSTEHSKQHGSINRTLRATWAHQQDTQQQGPMQSLYKALQRGHRERKHIWKSKSAINNIHRSWSAAHNLLWFVLCVWRWFLSFRMPTVNIFTLSPQNKGCRMLTSKII